MRTLRDVERTAGFSNRALSRQLERHPELDPRDRGLATTLVYGVLRHRTRLDAHIDAHARKPAGLKGEVRQLLRIGAFELLELQRPAAIVVSEISGLVRGLDPRGRMGGVAQALLGAVARTAQERDRELEQGEPDQALQRRWSIPGWLARRWVSQLGAQRALARARALAEAPPVDLRIDLSRIDPQQALERLRADHPGARFEVVPEQPQAVRAHGAGDIFYGPLHAEGLVSVQGLAAQQAVRALSPAPGERVLDACAGMGVKSLQVAELMQRRGSIVAADLDPSQLAQIEALRARGDLDRPELSLRIVQADLADAVPELDAEGFDAVLLDVPCTGLGNLGRHPESRWHRKPDDIEARARLQRALLERNLQRVAPGGRLVYAACTFEPEEGPDLVRAVANATGARVEWERTFTPEDDATEGFYLARLRPHGSPPHTDAP